MAQNNGSKNIIEKIWEAHTVDAGGGKDLPAILAIDFMLIHEVTSAQAFDLLREKGIPIADKGRLLATLDHSIPTRKNRFQIFDDSARHQVETLRKNCREFDVPLFDFESGYQGIVHVIGPELGITQPGMTIVCGDSHTSTHGAFGAMAFGVGTSEVGHVLASGCILQKKPKSMLVNFLGLPGKSVYSKDIILKLISEIGIGGGNGHIIEYAGEAIRVMSMEERMTVCNMSIECGARAGLIAPDDTTFKYLKGRKFAPKAAEWEKALEQWRYFVSDEGASFDKKHEVDLKNLKPMVTWGTNPGQASEINSSVPLLSDLSDAEQTSLKHSLDYVKLSEGQKIEGTKIDWAFVGSCTNGRIEDMRLVAKVLNGKKVKDSVTMYIVPGSEQVLKQVEEEGLDKIFKDAGADLRMPGCSMCLGMNDDLVPPGKRCISSSNRNFMGRQGPGSITHLASPVTVAASAISGVITSPEEFI
jgi:3-isopropylmalate/(R)-2-methylmalate dehydratase large subunit